MKINLPSDLAKYPFLDEAGQHVKKYGAELRDLDNIEYENIVKGQLPVEVILSTISKGNPI